MSQGRAEERDRLHAALVKTENMLLERTAEAGDYRLRAERAEAALENLITTIHYAVMFGWSRMNIMEVSEAADEAHSVLPPKKSEGEGT